MGTTRIVVMDDSLIGRPVYIAFDEADAAQFLDKTAEEARQSGNTPERQNSLTMIVKVGQYGAKRYTCHTVPSAV